MRGVALVRDLFFQVRIQETARIAGVDCAIVSTTEEALTCLQKGARLAILDLEFIQMAGCREFVEIVKVAAPGAQILGYAPHVRTDLFEAARTAGIETVLPRSQFSKWLPLILTGQYGATRTAEGSSGNT